MLSLEDITSEKEHFVRKYVSDSELYFSWDFNSLDDKFFKNNSIG